MAASLKASKQGIEIVDQARKKKGWAATAAAWYQDAKTSAATLKRFRRGKPIQQDTFIAICKAVGIENWDEIVDESPNQPEVSPVLCSAYNEETWVGREELIRQLSQKLKGQCQVLIITGITGLGKTALAERLATVELRQDYPNYKVVNFDEGAGTQDFVSAAENLLKQLGEEVTDDERKNSEGLLNRLLQKLRNHRCLVQMDSLEVLLKGHRDDDRARNEFEDELWSVFFNGLLAGQDCQSRLILTSQDLPTQFGNRYEKFWAEEPLKGLNEAEQFELFQKLFRRKEKEIEPKSEAAGYLKRMGNAYEGHPLVIEVIAGEILAAPFNGNVMAYWHKYRQEFEAIKPVIGHQQLQLQVNDRVRKALKRLAQDVPDAYILLCRSSVYRRSVPESFWLAMLGNLTEEQKAAALGILQFRYLAFAEGATSDGQFLLRQHNLIRSVAYELLEKTAKDSSKWQDAHYTAAKMWRIAYEPEPDAPNLEKVRGYLEAFHHFCEVEDWEKASDILALKLDAPTNGHLLNLLRTWGYYREQIALFRRLLGKLDSHWDSAFLNNLGIIYCSLGEYQQALDNYQQSLTISREIGDRSSEGIALHGLGCVYFSRGDYSNGIDYYDQSLVISREIGDRPTEFRTLDSLGNIYYLLGNYAPGIEIHQQQLAMAQEISDRAGEGKALSNLGNAYCFLEEYHQAIHDYQQSLSIAIEIGDRTLQGIAFGGLGNVYHYLGKNEQAIDYYQQRLTIVQELDDRADEGLVLSHIGNVYRLLGEYDKAIDYYQEDLKIARLIGTRAWEGRALFNLGIVYHSREDYRQAINYYQQSLTIVQQIQDRFGEDNLPANLAHAYYALGDYEKAIAYNQQHLAIVQSKLQQLMRSHWN
jgi:tetratricopeptide (TPR) repeat protein